jgi:hypothetical protein
MLPLPEAKEGRITMKKIATLILAAGLVFGVSTGAKAIDFKAHGEWIVDFNYGMHHNGTGANGQTGYGNGEDEFEAQQRVRLQLDAVASEALSGTVFFEIGQQLWGQANAANGNAGYRGGAALGADGTTTIKVRRAYIDWMVPQTDLKVRMGIQGFALPSFTTKANPVFDDDVAAVVASYQFNENVGLTAFWLRPFNDNSNAMVREDGRTIRNANYMDNLDAFGLLLPLSFDGVKVTPWVMYAAIGPDTFRNNRDYLGNINVANMGTDANHVRHGMFPVGGALRKDGTASGRKLKTYGDAIWAGLTGEVTAFDPFRIAWDVNYGSVRYDDGRMNRSGWLASLLFEYKLDWAIPGIYGWYASGDDSNPANGSERMPYIGAAGNNDFSRYAFSGGTTFGRESVVSDSMVGTWGIGARLKDMSFLEDLKHTFRINFMGGTNSTTMARYFYGNRAGDYDAGVRNGGLGAEQLYMTTNDYALEFGLYNAYKMYENFTVALDANYICLMRDHSKKVWGNAAFNGKDDTTMDPWNVRLSFIYSF